MQKEVLSQNTISFSPKLIAISRFEKIGIILGYASNICKSSASILDLAPSINKIVISA